MLSDRLGCLNHHRRGTCTNNRTILREKLEARVLTGLQERLVSAEAVEEAVRAYVEETNRLTTSAVPSTKPTVAPWRRSSAPLRGSSRPSRTACISHP
ncbi:hypothetical protein [Chelativorans alearense]|uniref:hypothetical protein n=1 Tax=Chelativorans alearense TaxID=2681495 RepID=UPI003CCD6424